MAEPEITKKIITFTIKSTNLLVHKNVPRCSSGSEVDNVRNCSHQTITLVLIIVTIIHTIICHHQLITSMVHVVLYCQ